MELADQVQLIREFMLRIAPEITRYTLRSIDHQVDTEFHAARRTGTEYPGEEHLALLRNHAAGDCARMCLEHAMHLAGQFANCYDSMSEAHKRSPAKDALATQLEATAPLQREIAPGTRGL